jgi:hypothetical protein
MDHRSAKRTCDVLVVGAGVAGIAAALSASREGADTVMIEKNSFPGGMAITGMHRVICGLYLNGTDTPDAPLNNGIAAEICTGLKRLAPDQSVEQMGKVYVLPYSREDLTTIIRSLSEGAPSLGAWYDTRAISAKTSHNTITAVTVRNRDKVSEISPGAVIDCSGHGTIIQLSGAGYELSPPHQQQLAGFTFRVKGLQHANEMSGILVPYYLRLAAMENKMPPYVQFTTFRQRKGVDEGTCRLNVPPALKNRDAKARDLAHQVHAYLRQVLPSFRDTFIAEMASEVAEREGVRVSGEYTLSKDDVLNAKKFPDGVVKGTWPIELWDQEKGPRYQYLDPGAYYEIPLRCLKAKDIANCFCAGRCISASQQALGSTRVMGTCISLGEAAGRAAARYAASIVKAQ